MADSDNAANLPEGMDLYAAYVDGYSNYDAAVARFGKGKVVSISVDGAPAQVGDVEKGALTIQQAIRIGYGTVYCSTSGWPANVAAYRAAGKPQPQWWVAAYPGIGPTIPAGAIAHQYQDVGPYDLSVVADVWPGIDTKGSADQMLILTTAGQPALLVLNGAAVGIPTATDETALNAAGVPTVPVSPQLFEAVYQASAPQLKQQLTIPTLTTTPAS